MTFLHPRMAIIIPSEECVISIKQSCSDSRHSFLMSRSRLGTLKFRKMGMSRRDIWVGRIFYFYETISGSKYAESNPVSGLPNNVQSVILWRPMVVKSKWIY